MKTVFVLSEEEPDSSFPSVIIGIYETREVAEKAKSVEESHYHHRDGIWWEIEEYELQK
jgi:hypothetical protein